MWSFFEQFTVLHLGFITKYLYNNRKIHKIAIYFPQRQGRKTVILFPNTPTPFFKAFTTYYGGTECLTCDFTMQACPHDDITSCTRTEQRLLSVKMNSPMNDWTAVSTDTLSSVKFSLASCQPRSVIWPILWKQVKKLRLGTAEDWDDKVQSH